MKVVRLALRTGPVTPPGNIPGTHFCYSLGQPQGHSAAGRMSMKNSSDTIGNRTCDPHACSTVPQPTTSSRAPRQALKVNLILSLFYGCFNCRCFTAWSKQVPQFWTWYEGSSEPVSQHLFEFRVRSSVSGFLTTHFYVRIQRFRK